MGCPLVARVGELLARAQWRSSGPRQRHALARPGGPEDGVLAAAATSFSSTSSASYTYHASEHLVPAEAVWSLSAGKTDIVGRTVRVRWSSARDAAGQLEGRPSFRDRQTGRSRGWSRA